ncbi:unnamed protein product [Auanema sp. JU1783]|nr:unnamed protein product [Auanema sp. JU1783]
MGRMDVNNMRYLEGEHFRVLIAVEMGMKNHEIVPLPLIAAVAGIHRGAVSRSLSDLSKLSLVAFERSRKFDGYRLTVLGYDYLALKALCGRSVVGSVGNKIGVGKESDVYVGGDPDLNDLCLKFHRLGRTSFRKIKEKRDYHKKRKSASWLYLSRLAAAKEFAFLKALSDHGFPVPRPVDVCRHVVVMGLIEGATLCNIGELSDPAGIYNKLMCLIVKLGRYGLIHGDFNEFNLMIMEETGKIILIDFPQMISTDHDNAEYYFNRDVDCIRTLFRRKYNYESEEYPKFSDVSRKFTLDVELEASGFTKQMALDLNKAYDVGNFLAHCETDDRDSDEDEEEEEVEEEGGVKDDTEQDKEEGDDDEDDDDSDDDTILEENEDLDKEELKAEQIDREKKAKALGKSERFMDWLDTTEKFDNLALEVDNDCPLLIHPKDVERLEEIKRDREEYIKKREEADRLDAENAESPNDNADSDDDMAHEPKKTKSKRKGARSIMSTTSTIPLEEVKRRVALEAFRNKEKVKLRVKGKQSAVGRGRKENHSVIKEYSGWI